MSNRPSPVIWRKNGKRIKWGEPFGFPRQAFCFAFDGDVPSLQPANLVYAAIRLQHSFGGRSIGRTRSSSANAQARSIAFCSSPTFPGQP